MTDHATVRSLPVFIGDEVSAAGFRLAGLRVLSPPAGAASQVVADAAREAPLVLLGAPLAARLPADLLERLLAATDSQVVLVPDLRGDTVLPDLTARVRRQLGVLE
jgi:vacuolar-type H+-ATPase subunit F/Vma7